jgi:hypothetical protein
MANIAQAVDHGAPAAQSHHHLYAIALTSNATACAVPVNAELAQPEDSSPLRRVTANAAVFRPILQTGAVGSATLTTPVTDAHTAGGRPAIKRPAPIALVLVTEENKRFRTTLERTADEWLCPISQEVPWDPVMAEDLRYYERDSIEKWFERNKAAVRSPVTGEPMGRILKSVPQVRNAIEILVESGGVTDDKAEYWKKRLAQKKEVILLRQRAAAGNAEAMFTLGASYAHGENGLPKDKAQAFSWLKRAADLGDVHAMLHVGLMYCYGKGVTSNDTRGTIRLGQAAALGLDWACYYLGKFHQNGLYGFDKDPAEAATYYAQIASCTIKDSSGDTRLTKAAEWLKAHSLQPSVRPSPAI